MSLNKKQEFARAYFMTIIKSTIKNITKQNFLKPLSSFFISNLFETAGFVEKKKPEKQKPNHSKKLLTYGMGIILVFTGFSVQAQDKCKELFTSKAFAKAMTENLQLLPTQGDLFHLYRVNYFGNPDFNPAHTFKELTDVLQKHPELSKTPMREQWIQFERRLYKAPDSLILFIKEFQNSYIKVKGSLFHIEENWGFWEKLLSMYKEDQIEQSKQTFKEYLSVFLDKMDRAFLAESSYSYKKRALFLFKALNKIRKEQMRENKKVQKISQAMLDLVHTVGLESSYIKALIKSKDAMEQLKGVYQALEERHSMSQELGFNNFANLQQTLEAPASSGWSKNDNIYKTLIHIEKEIKNSSFYTEAPQIFRARALSLQESPFRSCLGGTDCSSNTYFFKALDPNFYYWTLTDPNYKSSGHITVVLGTAQNEQGKRLKIGFIDKVQEVPTEMILPMLESLGRSLLEKGYKLGIPQDVGDEVGLSNTDEIREYFDTEINSQLKRKLTKFQPHKNSYPFPNSFSRAYDELTVYEYQGILFNLPLQIKPGKIHRPKKANKNLNAKSWYHYILSLKDSNKEEDQIQFIKQLVSFVTLEFISFEKAKNHLSRTIKNKSFSLKLRKLAFFTLTEFSVTAKQNLSYKDIMYFLSQFSNKEQKNIIGEMSNWQKSKNIKRKSFIIGLTRKRPEQEIMSILNSKDLSPILKNLTPDLIWAANMGYKDVLEHLIEERSIDLNVEDRMGNTLVMLAAWKGNEDLLKWLIKRGADIYKRNDQGESALSLAVRKGHSSIVTLLLEHIFEKDVLDVLDKSLIEHAKNIAELEGHTFIAKLLQTFLFLARVKLKRRDHIKKYPSTKLIY